MISIKNSQDIAKNARGAFDKKFSNTFKTPQDFLVDLTEEVGELTKVISDKEIRKQQPREGDLEGELIDVYMDLLWLANHYGVDLEKEFINKINKWNKRYDFNLKI
ncbi:MAG: hypothetical protein HY831_04395 [Candidatus Aenigmarchaeota archaeon]|nr:hypothetical protein [Candidatus Aenigmarchaeota archaeon]